MVLTSEAATQYHLIVKRSLNNLNTLYTFRELQTVTEQESRVFTKSLKSICYAQVLEWRLKGGLSTGAMEGTVNSTHPSDPLSTRISDLEWREGKFKTLGTRQAAAEGQWGSV